LTKRRQQVGTARPGEAQARAVRPAPLEATGPDIERLAAELEAQLRAAGSPERATSERAYLKSELEFLGTAVPIVRRVAKELLAGPELPAGNHDRLVALVECLWSAPVHERRALAIELLGMRSALLVAGDLDLVERLLRDSYTWAYVDSLAVRVAGAIIERHPETVVRLDQWVEDPDFWLRRSAMLALLLPLRQGAGDAGRFLSYADRLLDEREFFIRKAIGWVLRDMGRKRPELVLEWIAPRTHRASGVTVREAVKCLPADDAAAILEAYRERRPCMRR
jgi:3-methyladenine DNA glycosylase AlkD